MTSTQHSALGGKLVGSWWKVDQLSTMSSTSISQPADSVRALVMEGVILFAFELRVHCVPIRDIFVCSYHLSTLSHDRPEGLDY